MSRRASPSSLLCEEVGEGGEVLEDDDSDVDLEGKLLTPWNAATLPSSSFKGDSGSRRLSRRMV